MYSAIVDGKVLDYKYKKLQDNHYAFYLEDIYVGQLFKMSKHWSCVGKTPNELCPIEGFRTRFDACEMLLKLEGYRKRDV